ncbi:lamin tail domain-containing protein [Massilia sp. Dwa41.01b]|nr:lamin tail domain-containing protein [Massilia sp. Dwa41.01b]
MVRRCLRRASRCRHQPVVRRWRQRQLHLNRDFVELFNRSGAPVSLKGMSLQYQSAAGTTWQAGALPDVTLAPGQYFLVAGSAGTGATSVRSTIPGAPRCRPRPARWRWQKSTRR